MYTLWTNNYKSFKLIQVNDIVLEFSGAEKAGRALVGDIVNMVDGGCILVKRTQHPKLAGVLQLNSKTIYGMTSRGARIYLFVPFDRRYPPMRVGSSEKDRSVNRIALVDFDSWTEKEHLPRATLDRVLGIAGDFSVDRLALAHTASPWHKPVLSIPPQERRMRSPSRIHLGDEWSVVNIDPEGCRDIDDIICMSQSGNNWTVIIGISDLTDDVPEDGPLDIYAQKTMQTIYDNGRAVRPMLPEVYSESMFSLLPGSPRLIVGLEMNYIPNNDEGFRIANVSFGKYSVVNKRSYTYDTIRDADDFPVATLAALVQELAGRPVTDTHDWVAELMKFYNLRAAELIAGKGGVLRVHSGPKAERLVGLEPALAERLVMAAAEYDVQGVHYGFGWKPYVQVTSPIRRYCDMINQRVLVRVLQGLDDDPISREVISRMNWASKAAKQFERACTFMDLIQNSRERIIEISQTSGLGSHHLNLSHALNQIECTVLDTTDDKTRLWVPSWSMVIKVAACDAPIGSTVSVEYFYNAALVNWKEKMVFKLVA
jgi:exoribonuclease R